MMANMHFWYFTWRSICIFDTLHEGQYVFLILYMKANMHIWSYLAQFFLEWEMFQTKAVQEIKTHILRSIIIFSKILPFFK